MREYPSGTTEPKYAGNRLSGGLAVRSSPCRPEKDTYIAEQARPVQKEDTCPDTKQYRHPDGALRYLPNRHRTKPARQKERTA